jgi:hypothetical protein
MSSTLPVQSPSEPVIKKSVHHLDFTPKFFVVDVVLRYCLLAAWRYGGLSTLLFWIGQAGLALGFFAFFGMREERLKERLSLAKDVRLEPEGTATVILWLLFSAHACYQVFALVHPQQLWLRVTSVILLSLVAIFYYIGIAVHSYPGKVKEPAGEPYAALEDENDRILIRLRTELVGQERRIESYTVESTLIGALAFSAFVTIISSDKMPQAEVMAEVGRDFSRALAMLVSLNLAGVGPILTQLSAEKPVLAIVATLSLTCSTFFLAVIVARLRFNSLVALANYSIEVAGTLNEKEEALYMHQLAENPPRSDLGARINYLRECIQASLEEAQIISQQLEPIVLYMTVFRHLGVLSFLLALVASAVWISPILAIAFAIISLGAYSYPIIDRKLRDRNLLRLAFFRLPAFFRRGGTQV